MWYAAIHGRHTHTEAENLKSKLSRAIHPLKFSFKELTINSLQRHRLGEYNGNHLPKMWIIFTEACTKQLTRKILKIGWEIKFLWIWWQGIAVWNRWKQIHVWVTPQYRKGWVCRPWIKYSSALILGSLSLIYFVGIIWKQIWTVRYSARWKCYNYMIKCFRFFLPLLYHQHAIRPPIIFSMFEFTISLLPGSVCSELQEKPRLSRSGY